MKVGLATITALVCAVGVARAESPQALLERHRCYVCHADHETKTGPAYVDVAARYKGDRRAEARLVAEVRKGTHGSGPWHMPPHQEVSAADAKTMLRYILSLRQ